MWEMAWQWGQGRTRLCAWSFSSWPDESMLTDMAGLSSDQLLGVVFFAKASILSAMVAYSPLK
jgi:hypothetical protein